METGGSLSKGKEGSDLAGQIGFGSKVVAGGNQGANSLAPSFTCHNCKEVGQGKIEGRPCKIWLDTGANRSTVPARYIAEVSYTGKEGARLANGTVEMLRTAEVTIQVDGIVQQMTCFCSRQRCQVRATRDGSQSC